MSRRAGPGQVIEFLDGEADRFGVSLGSSVPAFLGPRRSAGTVAVAPLLLPDGRPYGQIGCLDEHARPSLQPRDEQFLQLVAALLGPSISALDERRVRRARTGARVQAVLDSGGPAMVYQPIWALAERRLVGYEALARFPHEGESLTRTGGSPTPRMLVWVSSSRPRRFAPASRRCPHCRPTSRSR